MDTVEEIVTQGTYLRVADPTARAATFAQTDDVVTVTRAAHGHAVGDRIIVDTAVDGAGATGVVEVATVVDAATFTYAASTSIGTPVSAKAMSYRVMYSADIKSFNGPGGSAAVIDATNLTHKAKRKRLGMPDEGQLQAGVNFVPGNLAQSILREARRRGTRLDFELAFTDEAIPTAYIGFKGYVMTFSLSGQLDGLVEGSLTIEIDGELTEYQDAE